MTMQKHVFAALLLTCTTNAGAAETLERRLQALADDNNESSHWIAEVRCTSSSTKMSTGSFHKGNTQMTEQQNKDQCTSACDANDSCVAAEFWYSPKENSTGAGCWLFEDCEIDDQEQHPTFQVYFKDGVPAPTPAPVPEPTGDWETGVHCNSGLRTMVFEKQTQWSEQQAMAECASLCDADDLCKYADLWFSTNLGATCYTLGVCGDQEEHPLYRLYTKCGVPTPTPTSEPESAQCTGKNIDRWDPDLGGCCEGLEMRTEPRDQDDSWYCPVDDAQHGQTCYSTIQMCRDPNEFVDPTPSPSLAPTPAPSPSPTKPQVVRCPPEFPSCVSAYWFPPQFSGLTACVLASCADDSGNPECDWQVHENYINFANEDGERCEGDYEPAIDAQVPDAQVPATDSEEGCADLTVQTNMLVSIKKGKKQMKKMKLEDPVKEDVCECAELCETAGFDIFQYYSKVKRGKVKTSCQCMNVTNKVKAKTKKGHTTGALTAAAEEAFSKFKVKTSKKDQKAGL